MLFPTVYSSFISLFPACYRIPLLLLSYPTRLFLLIYRTYRNRRLFSPDPFIDFSLWTSHSLLYSTDSFQKVERSNQYIISLIYPTLTAFSIDPNTIAWTSLIWIPSSFSVPPQVLRFLSRVNHSLSLFSCFSSLFIAFTRKFKDSSHFFSVFHPNFSQFLPIHQFFSPLPLCVKCIINIFQIKDNLRCNLYFNTENNWIMRIDQPEEKMKSEEKNSALGWFLSGRSLRWASSHVGV